MDPSPLGKLGEFPGEIRNQLFDLVLNSGDTTMEVRIDEEGKADQTVENKLALTAVCKQLRQETAGLDATETTTFILKPHCSLTPFGNKTLTKLFDLDKWLDKIKTFPTSTQRASFSTSARWMSPIFVVCGRGSTRWSAS